MAPPKVISLENPTIVDPSLLLMTTYQSPTNVAPLFTHNCHIKQSMATLILNNDSYKNLIVEDLV